MNGVWPVYIDWQVSMLFTLLFGKTILDSDAQNIPKINAWWGGKQ